MSETPGEVWESDDCVRRTVVLPSAVAERLAVQAERLTSATTLMAVTNGGSGASKAPKARDGAWQADRMASEAIRRRLPVLSG